MAKWVKGQSGNPLGGHGKNRKKISNLERSASIRQRIMDVWDELELDEAGRLISLAKDQPKWFFETFVKPMIPKDVTMDATLDLHKHETILEELE